MEDMACFCGGLGKFSEMLTNVKALLCEAEEFHDQDHDDDHDDDESLLGAAAPSLESDANQDQESMTLCSPTCDIPASWRGRACSLCTFDIMSAYDECKHHIIKTSIRTCINDILGTTSDCLECVCDVLPVLCEAGESHDQDDDDDSLLGAAAPSLESDATLNQESMRMCSIKEMLSCTGEIESAYDDCSHMEHIASIRTCINDILGASDCYKCVCDVLPILCGTEESQDDDDDSLFGPSGRSLESSPDSGVLDLFEGNDATQNQVCTLRWGHQVKTIATVTY